MAKISKLENKTSKIDLKEEEKFGAPSFLTHLKDLTVREGESATFTAEVQPKKDATLQTGKGATANHVDS